MAHRLHRTDRNFQSARAARNKPVRLEHLPPPRLRAKAEPPAVPVTVMVSVEGLSRFPASEMRASVDSDLVVEFCEQMRAGAEFPAVTIFEEPDGTRHLADGVHRAEGAALAARQDRGRKAEVLAEVRPGTLHDAVIFAMRANSRHGARLTGRDYQRQIKLAIDRGLVALNRPDGIASALAELLACSQRTALVYSADIRQELRDKRDQQIHAMREQGLSQARIAKATGVDQKTVSDVIARRKRSAAEIPSPQPPLLDVTITPVEPIDNVVSVTVARVYPEEPAEQPESQPPFSIKSGLEALDRHARTLHSAASGLDRPEARQTALDAIERSIGILCDLERVLKGGVGG